MNTWINGWVVFGFLGQAIFAARFIIQWIVSEKKKESFVPLSFWYFSIAGGVVLLIYAIYKKDPVFMLGQASGLVVYVRNLMLIMKKRILRREIIPMQQPQSEAIAHSPSAPPHKLSSDFINISILLLAGAIILFINIGGWDLWNPDEPRYAQVAREMMQTGNYLVPHINSEIYPDKPPLFFWLIALASKPFGDVTAASARIPSAIACLGVILLTYLFGRILYNQTVGFLAGLILLPTPNSPGLLSGLTLT